MYSSKGYRGRHQWEHVESGAGDCEARAVVGLCSDCTKCTLTKSAAQQPEPEAKPLPVLRQRTIRPTRLRRGVFK
jgi:hypothetical protein